MRSGLDDVRRVTRRTLINVRGTRALFIPMAKILTFKSRSTNTQQAATPDTVVIPAGPGSLAPAAISPTGNWLRNMITMKCLDCNHEWVQPADKGRCIVCMSDNTAPILKRFDASTRV